MTDALQQSDTAPTPQNLAAEMVPRSWGDLQEFAEVVSQSQLCPKSYRGKPQDAALAILYGMELGLRPLQSLQSVAVINGRPSIYGDAALALVEQSGLAEYVKEWQEQTDDRGLVAYCETQKQGKPEPTTQSFSEKKAKHAGLWDSRGPWQSYPGRMLQMRARSWCLRDAYPEVLEGLMLAEEAEAIPESNGPTLDPKGDLSRSERPENGETEQKELKRAFRNGVSIPADQAKVYDKWNARLSELEGEELHDAIDTAEETMAAWGEEKQLLKRALTDLLDEHQQRLDSSRRGGVSHDLNEMKERVEEHEQKSSDPEGTQLPEGMENRNFLISAGVDTVEKLHTAVQSEEHNLEDLDGIGEKTAESARQWLQNRSE